MKHKGCTLHNPKHGQGFPWCPNTQCSVYRRTRTWNPFSTSQTGCGKSVRRKKTNAWTTLPRSWTGSCKTRLNPPHFKTDVITPLMAMYRWTASTVNPRTTATSRKTNYRTYHLYSTIWVSKRRSGKRTRQAKPVCSHNSTNSRIWTFGIPKRRMTTYMAGKGLTAPCHLTTSFSRIRTKHWSSNPGSRVVTWGALSRSRSKNKI